MQAFDAPSLVMCQCHGLVVPLTREQVPAEVSKRASRGHGPGQVDWDGEAPHKIHQVVIEGRQSTRILHSNEDKGKRWHRRRRDERR